ncbi:TPA: RseA family anti-sigma factor [Escherichia coli]
MQKEQLSALMDGETLDSELLKFNRLSGVDDSGILDKGIRHAERTTFRFNGWRNAG